MYKIVRKFKKNLFNKLLEDISSSHGISDTLELGGAPHVFFLNIQSFNKHELVCSLHAFDSCRFISFFIILTHKTEWP